MLRIQCPNPEAPPHSLKLNDKLAGKRITCPHCKFVFRVPGGPETNSDPSVFGLRDEDAPRSEPSHAIPPWTEEDPKKRKDTAVSRMRKQHKKLHGEIKTMSVWVCGVGLCVLCLGILVTLQLGLLPFKLGVEVGGGKLPDAVGEMHANVPLLWWLGLPTLGLALGLAVGYLVFVRNAEEALEDADDLTEEERARVSKLLEADE